MRLLYKDQIGRLGELLTETEFCKPVLKGLNRPLFRANGWGGKYPVVDFIVDCLDSEEKACGFFYVQTKSTASCRSSSSRSLRIDCRLSKYNALVGLPVPTYIAGVDVWTEEVYLVAAHTSRKRRLSSMARSHDLASDEIKLLLYEEVMAYCTGPDIHHAARVDTTLLRE